MSESIFQGLLSSPLGTTFVVPASFWTWGNLSDIKQLYKLAREQGYDLRQFCLSHDGIDGVAMYRFEKMYCSHFNCDNEHIKVQVRCRKCTKMLCEQHAPLTNGECVRCRSVRNIESFRPVF
jgi:hypothetical protein